MAPSEVAKRLHKGAGKGSAEDQYDFGVLHYGTEGVKRNLPTAAEWIKKAATQGLAAAQASLGDLHSPAATSPRLTTLVGRGAHTSALFGSALSS
jgi:TPR repeat protein